MCPRSHQRCPDCVAWTRSRQPADPPRSERRAAPAGPSRDVGQPRQQLDVEALRQPKQSAGADRCMYADLAMLPR